MTSPHLERPKPGLAFCILVPLAVWLLLGVVAVGLFVRGFIRFNDIVDDFARVEVGEQAEVELDAGGHRVWAETDGEDDSLYPSSVSLTIEPVDGGDPVTLEPYSRATVLTYGTGSRHGEAVQTFDIAEAGLYTVTVDSDTASVDRVAIGTENPVSTTGKHLGAGFVIGFIGFVAGVILMIVLLVRRSRSKRRLTAAATGFGTGGFGPGTQAPGPGWGPPGGHPPPGPTV